MNEMINGIIHEIIIIHFINNLINDTKCYHWTRQTLTFVIVSQILTFVIVLVGEK